MGIPFDDNDLAIEVNLGRLLFNAIFTDDHSRAIWSSFATAGESPA
jgi:hypothetical protein